MAKRKSESSFKSTERRTYKRAGRLQYVAHSHKDLQHNVAQLNWGVSDCDEWVARASKADEYINELVNYTYLKHGFKISRRKLFMKLFEDFMDKNPIPKTI
jgi:hypothetical protein